MTLTTEQKKVMMIDKHLLKDIGNGEWLVQGCSDEDWFSSIQTPNHFEYYAQFWGEHVEAPENARCEVFVDYYKDILGTVKKSRSQLAAEKAYHFPTSSDDEWILDFKGAKIRKAMQPKLFDWLLLRRQLSLGDVEEEHPSTLPADLKVTQPTPTFNSKISSFKTILKDKATCMEFLLEHHRFGMDAAGQRWVSMRAFGKKIFEAVHPAAFRRILKEELTRCRNERVQFGKAIPYIESEEQPQLIVQQQEEEPLNNFLTEDIEPLPLTEEDRAFLQGEGGDNVLETGWWHDWENEEVMDEQPAAPVVERALYDAQLNADILKKEDQNQPIIPVTIPLKEKAKKKVKKMTKAARAAYLDRMRAAFGEAPRPSRFNVESGMMEEVEDEETLEETLLNTAFFVEETEEESVAMEDFISVLQQDEEQSVLVYNRNLGLLREWGVAGRDEVGDFVFDCTRQKQVYRNQFPLHYAYYEQHWLNNLRVHPATGDFIVDEEAPCDSFVATKTDENGRIVKTFEQLEFENHAGHAIFSGTISGQRMMLHAGSNFLKYVTDFKGQRIPYIPQFLRHVEAYTKMWMYDLPHVTFADVDASGLKTDIQLVIEGYIEASYENGNLHFMTIKAPMSEDGRPFVFWLMPSSFMDKVKQFWKIHDAANEGDTLVDTIMNEDGQLLRSMEQLQHDHNARLFEYTAGGGKILKKQWVKTETGVLAYNEDGSNEAEFNEYLFRWQRQLDMRDFLMPSNKRRLLDTGRIQFNAKTFLPSLKKKFGAAREMQVWNDDNRQLRLSNAAPTRERLYDPHDVAEIQQVWMNGMDVESNDSEGNDSEINWNGGAGSLEEDGDDLETIGVIKKDENENVHNAYLETLIIRDPFYNNHHQIRWISKRLSPTIYAMAETYWNSRDAYNQMEGLSHLLDKVHGSRPTLYIDVINNSMLSLEELAIRGVYGEDFLPAHLFPNLPTREQVLSKSFMSKWTKYGTRKIWQKQFPNHYSYFIHYYQHQQINSPDMDMLNLNYIDVKSDGTKTLDQLEWEGILFVKRNMKKILNKWIIEKYDCAVLNPQAVNRSNANYPTLHENNKDEQWFFDQAVIGWSKNKQYQEQKDGKPFVWRPFEIAVQLEKDKNGKDRRTLLQLIIMDGNLRNFNMIRYVHLYYNTTPPQDEWISEKENPELFNRILKTWQYQLTDSSQLLTPVSFKKRLNNTGKIQFTAKSSPLPILKVESEEVEEEIPPIEDVPRIRNNRAEIIANVQRRRDAAQAWVRSLYEQDRPPVRFVEADDVPQWMQVSNYSQNVYQPFVLPEEHSTYTPFYENSNSGVDTLINWWGARQRSIHFGRKRPYEEISNNNNNNNEIQQLEELNNQEEMSEGQFQRFQHMLDHAIMGSDAEGRAWVLDCNASHPNKIFIDERPYLFNYYLNYWTSEENEHVTLEECIDRIDNAVADANGNLTLRSMVALEHEYKHGVMQVHENGADFTDNWVIDFKGNPISSFPFTNHYDYYLQFWKEHAGDTTTDALPLYVDKVEDNKGHFLKTMEQIQLEGKANVFVRSSALLSQDQRKVLMWVLDFEGNRVYMSGLEEDDVFQHYITFWQKDIYNTMPRVPYAPEGISRAELIQMGILSGLQEKRHWVQSLNNGRVYEDELPSHYKFYLEQWLSGSGIHEKKNYLHLQKAKLEDGSSITVKSLGQLQFEGKMSFPSRESERLYEKWVTDFNGEHIDIWPYPAHYAFYLNYWRTDIHNNPDHPAPFVDLIRKPDGTFLKTMQQLQMDGVIQLFRHDMTNANDPSFHIVNARTAKQEWVLNFRNRKLFYGEVSNKEFKYYVNFYMEDVDGVKERIEYIPKRPIRVENIESNFSLKLKTPHLPLELKKGIGKRKGRYNMDTVRLGEELEEWGVAGIDILKNGGVAFWVLDREGNKIEKNSNVKLFNKMLRYWSDRRHPIVAGKGSPVEYATDAHGERIKSLAQLAKEHKHSEEGEGRVWVASFTPVRIYLNYAPRHYYYYRSFWQHDVHDDKQQIPFVDIVNGNKSIQQLEYEDKAFHVLLPDPEEEALFPKRDVAQVDWVRDFNGQKIFADVDPERFDFYLDFWKRDIHNDLPQIAPSDYTTFNGKITSTNVYANENDNVARLIKFGFMGVNHLGQPWVRDCDNHIILKEAFPEHFAYYAKRDPFVECTSFKKYSSPGVKSLKQLEVEGFYKDDGFMEHWVIDDDGQRIDAHRDPHYFDHIVKRRIFF